MNPSEDRELAIGAAQVAEVYLDREKTVEKDCEYIQKAGDLGLDLLVFPEFHIPASPYWYQIDSDYDRTGFYRALYNNAITVPGPSTDKLCAAAGEADVAVIIGATERDPSGTGTMYNSLVFIDKDGTLLGRRRKLKPTVDERLFHTGGTGEDLKSFDSSIGTLGGLICAEHTNHLAGFSMLALGEEIHASVWPAYCTPVFSEELCETRGELFGYRTRFHSNAGKVPSVIATGVVTEELKEAIGDPDLAVGGGPSSVVGWDGNYLAEPEFDGEKIVHATVNLNERYMGKANQDVLGHYNRFDIFTLVVNTDPQESLQMVDGPLDRLKD